MIERMMGMPDGTIGFYVSGSTQAGEVRQSMLPVLRHAQDKGELLKVLYVVDSSALPWSLGVLAKHIRHALKHASAIERCALVCDDRALRHWARRVGSTLPFAVRAYGEQDQSMALAWLCRRPLNAFFDIRPAADERVLRVIAPQGRLTGHDFMLLERALHSRLTFAPQLRGLVVEAASRPAFDDLGAFFRQLRLLSTLQDLPRVALVTPESLLVKLGIAAANRMVETEVRCFEPNDGKEAERWASGGYLSADAASVLGREGGGGIWLNSVPINDPPALGCLSLLSVGTGA